MILARLLLGIPGACLLIRGYLESRLPEGQIIERPIYIALYSVGVILLLGGLFLPLILRGCRKLILLRILSLSVCAVLLFIFVTAALIATGPLFVQKADGTELVMLVLGAPVIDDQPSVLLQSRADLAAEWAKDHPDCLMIVSGGKGGTLTEAEVIAGLMEEQGVDPDRIFLEKEAATTEENFRNVREDAENALDVTTDPIIVLTNWFHVYRLRYFIDRQGYGNVSFVLAPTPASVRLLWYAREVVLTIRYWFTGVS